MHNEVVSLVKEALFENNIRYRFSEPEGMNAEGAGLRAAKISRIKDGIRARIDSGNLEMNRIYDSGQNTDAIAKKVWRLHIAEGEADRAIDDIRNKIYPTAVDAVKKGLSHLR